MSRVQHGCIRFVGQVLHWPVCVCYRLTLGCPRLTKACLGLQKTVPGPQRTHTSSSTSPAHQAERPAPRSGRSTWSQGMVCPQGEYPSPNRQYATCDWANPRDHLQHVQRLTSRSVLRAGHANPQPRAAEMYRVRGWRPARRTEEVDIYKRVKDSSICMFFISHI